MFTITITIQETDERILAFAKAKGFQTEKKEEKEREVIDDAGNVVGTEKYTETVAIKYTMKDVYEFLRRYIKEELVGENVKSTFLEIEKKKLEEQRRQEDEAIEKKVADTVNNSVIVE